MKDQAGEPLPGNTREQSIMMAQALRVLGVDTASLARGDPPDDEIAAGFWLACVIAES